MTLQALRVPPGNHLEALKGAHQEQHNIRINEIVHGKRAITADTALRLGGGSPFLAQPSDKE